MKSALAALALLAAATSAQADCRFTFNFAYGSTALQRADALLLQDLAARYAGAAFSLSGHADDDGTEARNERIAALRANAVADRLVRAGMTPRRVISVGADWDVIPTQGSSSPLNRRVELFIDGCDPAAHRGARPLDAPGVAFWSEDRVGITRPIRPSF